MKIKLSTAVNIFVFIWLSSCENPADTTRIHIITDASGKVIKPKTTATYRSIVMALREGDELNGLFSSYPNDIDPLALDSLIGRSFPNEGFLTFALDPDFERGVTVFYLPELNISQLEMTQLLKGEGAFPRLTITRVLRPQNSDKEPPITPRRRPLWNH